MAALSLSVMGREESGNPLRDLIRQEHNGVSRGALRSCSRKPASIRPGSTPTAPQSRLSAAYNRETRRILLESARQFHRRGHDSFTEHDRQTMSG